MLKLIIKNFNSPILKRQIGQCITAGAIGCAGDAIAQRYIENNQKFDFNRSARFFVIPAFYIAPALTIWYVKVLERVGGRFAPLKRVALDQLVFSPPFSATVIFNFHLTERLFPESKAQKQSIKQAIPQAWNSLRLQYWEILKTSLTFWPTVQTLNFYLVPLHYRMLFVQTAALVWNTYLSVEIQK